MNIEQQIKLLQDLIEAFKQHDLISIRWDPYQDGFKSIVKSLKELKKLRKTLSQTPNPLNDKGR